MMALNCMQWNVDIKLNETTLIIISIDLYVHIQSANNLGTNILRAYSD